MKTVDTGGALEVQCDHCGISIKGQVGEGYVDRASYRTHDGLRVAAVLSEEVRAIDIFLKVIFLYLRKFPHGRKSGRSKNSSLGRTAPH